MKNKTLCFLTASAVSLSVMCNTLTASADEHLYSGWLLWHSYSDYSALDSQLYLRSPNGDITEISGDFVHGMNGDFGSSPTDIVFMAIDKSADEWDIYRYNDITGKITNLTPKSGYRNEDPKFSPDGLHIVFKRGFWDHSRNDFTYNLAEMNLHSGEVKMLTDDTKEQSMPYYSGDGKYIYYSEYENGISTICRLDRQTAEKETVFAENGVTAYYPITAGDDLYFSRWHSADNRNDKIVRFCAGEYSDMPFNSPDYNCSDSCYVGGNNMIYSSTKNGGYDLFFFDGNESYLLEYASTDKNELGAAFYSVDEIKKYAADSAQFLLGAESPCKNYDVNGDGTANSADMIHIREKISREIAE